MLRRLLTNRKKPGQWDLPVILNLEAVWLWAVPSAYVAVSTAALEFLSLTIRSELHRVSGQTRFVRYSNNNMEMFS